MGQHEVVRRDFVTLPDDPVEVDLLVRDLLDHQGMVLGTEGYEEDYKILYGDPLKLAQEIAHAHEEGDYPMVDRFTEEVDGVVLYDITIDRRDS